MLGRLAPLAVCLALWTFAAQAEPPSEAAPSRARRLFTEGMEHARGARWQEALAAFQEAYALAPAPAILFNLAGAQLRTGKLLVSLANYRRFLDSRDPQVGPAHRESARRQVALIEARIPRLRVIIEGLRPDDRLLLDDKRIYSNELEHDLWLDPGAHTLSIHRPAGHEEVRRIVLGEGEHRTMQFRVF